MIGKLSKRRKEASNFDKLTLKEGQFLGLQNHAENTLKACGKHTFWIGAFTCFLFSILRELGAVGGELLPIAHLPPPTTNCQPPTAHGPPPILGDSNTPPPQKVHITHFSKKYIFIVPSKHFPYKFIKYLRG